MEITRISENAKSSSLNLLTDLRRKLRIRESVIPNEGMHLFASNHLFHGMKCFQVPWRPSYAFR